MMYVVSKLVLLFCTTIKKYFTASFHHSPQTLRQDIQQETTVCHSALALSKDVSKSVIFVTRSDDTRMMTIAGLSDQCHAEVVCHESMTINRVHYDTYKWDGQKVFHSTYEFGHTHRKKSYSQRDYFQISVAAEKLWSFDFYFCYKMNCV